jgi:hypothetical protein
VLLAEARQVPVAVERTVRLFLVTAAPPWSPSQSPIAKTRQDGLTAFGKQPTQSLWAPYQGGLRALDLNVAVSASIEDQEPTRLAMEMGRLRDDPCEAGRPYRDPWQAR